MLREDSDTAPTAKWQTVSDQRRRLLVLKEILKGYFKASFTYLGLASIVLLLGIAENAMISTF
jgi:hypothetical protein